MEQEKRLGGLPREAANDNGADTGKSADPRILRIAQAIGRHLAREYVRARDPKPTSDNTRK